ncbi:FAD-dependent oxidoreductase [Paracoccus sp. S-4012]|uniref:FAD-dependent oxidoreductase n=1 Tax=Paracoccus sp. S-4012 TaxID=2665648 RepID=UPI0012B0DBD3|nr:FAD-dependent oxidoreductase [Paracoccus sp. S-4012]MRX50524.1 FAD-dependent oxidoreductase [Paracoccus sp. S-4012]
MTEPARLHERPVAVIGGGIAGLTVAAALARRGASVTVHERAEALREVGAGIQISPNARRVLDALGLADRLEAISARAEAVELRDASGRRVTRLDLQSQRPGETFHFVHRARLLALLEEAARSSGVTIRLGEAVEDVPDAALIVGADGLHSQQRERLNGSGRPFFTGQAAWRALIPAEANPAPVAQVFMGPGRHLVSYPLGEGLRNIVGVRETDDWTAEGWSREDDPAAMRAAFQGFGGPVHDWLAKVERCGWWGLFRHEVARHWHDGRRVLIGDAAHPTLPFLAQGACMAIEDAWRLAVHLDRTPQAEALAAFEAERRPRVTRIVDAATANARNYHLTGLPKVAAHTFLRVGAWVAPGAVFGRYAWVYDYDPTVE